MKHTFGVICCVALWLGLLAPLASAQEEEVKERAQPVQEVFQTGLVYPQERGEVQLTYTSRFSKGKGRSSLHTPLNLEYGITDRWQVEVEWDAFSRRTETGEATTRGRGDLRIATQYSFMNMRHADFHSAVGVEITLPAGDVEKELGEGFIEYEPYFIVARDFPKLNNMQIFSQVGVGFVQRARRHAEAEDDDPAAHELNLGIGMFVPFRRLVLTGEINLSTNRWNNGGRERAMYATPGMVWRLPRKWEMGVDAPIGLTREADKFGAIFKLVYEFGTRRGHDAP